MKRIYSNNNVALAWHVRNMLEQHDIPVQMKNDKLYSIAGELPVTECMAEVWVKNPLHYRLAEKLVEELESGSNEEFKDWHCPDCGELIEGAFALCWNCQDDSSGKGGRVF